MNRIINYHYASLIDHIYELTYYVRTHSTTSTIKMLTHPFSMRCSTIFLSELCLFTSLHSQHTLSCGLVAEIWLTAISHNIMHHLDAELQDVQEKI